MHFSRCGHPTSHIAQFPVRSSAAIGGHSRIVKPRVSSKKDYASDHHRAIADLVFLQFAEWQRGDPIRIWQMPKVPPETTIGARSGLALYDPDPRGRRRLFSVKTLHRLEK
jgi:hypothetical protein